MQLPAVCIIGSDFDCTMCIHGNGIANQHVKLQHVGGDQYELTALDEQYPVFVDNQKISTTVISTDTSFQIGERDFTVAVVMQLLVSQNEQFWQSEVDLNEPANIMVVGSSAPADIVIDHPIVSPKHLAIRFVRGSLHIRDLASRYGSFVNQRAVGEQWFELELSDKLYLGNYHVPAKQINEWDWLLRSGRSPKKSKLEEKVQLAAKKVMLIGRDPTADVFINDSTVSWHHAKILHKRGRYRIIDLRSSNGTFVDEKRIRRKLLLPNQVLRVGNVQLQFDGELLSQDRTKHKDLRLDVDRITRELGNGKRIIDEISLSVYPGELVALMGPSGCGKSSLLELLSGEMRPTSGKVMLNNYDLYEYWEEFRHDIGYVPQEDIMHRDLTVYEVLYHSAKLRLPSDLPYHKIIQTVDQLLEQLGLDGIRNNLVGSTQLRGISGGQRKRLNIAIELLTEPSILFLDEPTSGLDAASTMEIMHILRELADQGKTIITTLHQPRIEAYHLVDNLIIMVSGGKLAYYGPANSFVYFEQQSGIAKEQHVNPADFVIDVLEQSSSQLTANDWKEAYLSSQYYQQFVMYRLGVCRLHLSTNKKIKRPYYRAQFSNLFTRYRRRKLRDLTSLVIQLLQAPIIAGLLSIIFYQEGQELLTMKQSLAMQSVPQIFHQVQLGNGIHPTLFLICAAAFWFGCSNVAREVVGDVDVFLREKRNGIRETAYLGSIFSYQLLMAGLQTFILVLFVWPLVGMHSSWLLAWLLLTLTAASGVATGVTISAIARTEVAAIAFMPIVLFPQILLGGYVKLYGELTLAGWQHWFADFMPVRWAFDALCQLEYLYVQTLNPDLLGVEPLIGFSDVSVLGALLPHNLFVCVVVLVGYMFINLAVTWLILWKK